MTLLSALAVVALLIAGVGMGAASTQNAIAKRRERRERRFWAQEGHDA